MGDIKKVRRKYTGPSHPWQRDRIDREKLTLKEYGFKNHTEIWKMISKLKNFKTQVKELATKSPTQRVLEEKQLLDRLFRLGLLNKDSTKEKVLDLTNEDLFNRRLQTIVFKKGLARTVKQARQLIVHGHIFVNGKKLNAPSYLVTRDEENLIVYSPDSQLNQDMHPERQRIVAKKEVKVEVKAPIETKTEVKLETKVPEAKVKAETPKVEVKEVKA